MQSIVVAGTIALESAQPRLEASAPYGCQAEGKSVDPCLCLFTCKMVLIMLTEYSPGRYDVYIK